MVRYPGKTHRAKVDGVEVAQLLEAVLWHHGAGTGVILTGPVKLFPAVLNTVQGTCRLEDTQSLRHHFRADAIAGDNRNIDFAHG